MKKDKRDGLQKKGEVGREIEDSYPFPASHTPGSHAHQSLTSLELVSQTYTHKDTDINRTIQKERKHI